MHRRLLMQSLGCKKSVLLTRLGGWIQKLKCLTIVDPGCAPCSRVMHDRELILKWTGLWEKI